MHTTLIESIKRGKIGSAFSYALLSNQINKEYIYKLPTKPSITIVF